MADEDRWRRISRMMFRFLDIWVIALLWIVFCESGDSIIVHNVAAFVMIPTRTTTTRVLVGGLKRRHGVLQLLPGNDNDDGSDGVDSDSDDIAKLSLPPSGTDSSSAQVDFESKSTTITTTAVEPSANEKEEDYKDDDNGESMVVESVQSTSSSSSSISPNPSTATTVLFINQQAKRILIEDLGYRRLEVERLRPELATAIVSKRIERPQDGVPVEWFEIPNDTTNTMMDRLEKEQKYPLKVPLIGISLILFGKGFGDAMITTIKVGIDFTGADLLVQETFMGVPVLAIDGLCIVLGAALGYWTWNTMTDD